jgi:hypothetical protein
MAEQKLVSRLLLIGLAVVVLAILVTQYTGSKKNDKEGNKAGMTGMTGMTGMAGMAGMRGREMFSEPQSSQSTLQLPSTTARAVSTMATAVVAPSASASASASSVQPAESSKNELYKAIDFNTEKRMPTDCAPRDKLTVEDLLPKDAANSKWAQVIPAGQGDVKDQNYLTAGYLSGVNTVGQSMRNANYQLRSDPPIDRMNVGPWNQTTIEFDTSRRFFEIGDC